MEGFNVYKDIQDRTHGEIYIGVVGPVRTGKSTFIKKFMDTVVIPHIPDGIQRERAIDELPQSSAGRTIMTTEPKFIPEQAVDVQIDEDASFRVRMIDCVGYIVPSAIGYIEEDQPRMVRTPWYEEPIPFNMAAEIGTKKVITEHSTIGLVITTDGTISDIPREEYEEAEERVIDELNQTGRPYVMLLNCVEPERPEARELAARLGEKYSIPVLPVNCIDITEQDIRDIIASLLYQFPVREVALDLPGWVTSLESGHWLLSGVLASLRGACCIHKMCQVKSMLERLRECEPVKEVRVGRIDLGSGTGRAELVFDQSLFYRIVGERTGGGGAHLGGAKNPQAKREVRHPPKGHGALHPHDENANPHRDNPHCGLGAAVRGAGDVPAQGVRGEPRENLGFQHLREVPPLLGQRGDAQQALPHARRRPGKGAGDHRAHHQRRVQRPAVHHPVAYAGLGKAQRD